MVAELDSSGGIAHRYVRTDDPDEIVTVYSDGTTASHRWVTNDERDSVLAEADATGALQSIDTYDEYGIPGAGNSGRFGYTGQMWLSQPGLYNYKARLYAPKVGFLQTDPVGPVDSPNLYRYAPNDPVNQPRSSMSRARHFVMLGAGFLMSSSRTKSRQTRGIPERGAFSAYQGGEVNPGALWLTTIAAGRPRFGPGNHPSEASGPAAG